MRKWIVLLMAAMIALPSIAMAAASLEEIQAELDEISDRLDKAEKHAAIDRITFTGDFRTKADSLHWQDAVWSPGVVVDADAFMASVMGDMAGWGYDINGTPLDPTDDFFTPNGVLDNFTSAYGLTIADLGMLKGLVPFAMMPVPVVSKDIDNDFAATTRLRLNFKADVYKNVNFAGRLSMYKNWGDSTGVQVFDSWNAFTMDGTDGGNTTGDWLRVERAYFNWKDIGGTPFFYSIGRRPSTYGPPSQYRENEMRGGTPGGHLVHFNFDGMTLGYKLDNVLEGMAVRFCYGQGFESQVGNGEMFNETVTDDTHLGGFAVDVLNNGTTLIQAMAFGAKDVVDGFKGTFAFPTQFAKLFAPTMYQDMQNFPNMNFVTRYQPSTTIGDMYLGGLSVSREEMNGINYFGSVGWTRLDSNGKAGMFGGMGSDMVYNAALDGAGGVMMVPTGVVDDDSSQDGYGIYVGTQLPVMDGVKLGLEYNYGSKYWTPFTQAQDDMLGSKLATRGHVGEVYSIFEVNPRTFIKLAGLYYDYEYTGSGSPVGKPQNIDEVLAGKAYSMLPVADTAWDANISFNVSF